MKKKSIVAIIPARMGSSRFPGKPMAEIHGIPMIGHVYFRTKMCPLLNETYVATCDQEIFDYIISIGGKAVMTADTHERCSDRTAEAMLKIESETGRKVDIVEGLDHAGGAMRRFDLPPIAQDSQHYLA